MNSSYIYKGTVLLFSLIAVIGINANQKVNIVNNTANQLHADLTIPEYTEAQIQMHKLNQLQSAGNSTQDQLFKAITKESKEEIQKAIRAGANVNHAKGDILPLMFAVLLKKPRSVEYLLECGARPSKDMIEYALKVYDVRMAYVLAKKCGLDINTFYKIETSPGNFQEGTLIFLALSRQDLSLALELAKQGITWLNKKSDIQSRVIIHNTIVQLLVMWSDDIKKNSIIVDILQEFINHGCNVNDIWICFKLAYNGNNSGKLISFLLSKGANPNYMIGDKDYYSTPLFLAIDKADCALVKTLVEAGADVNLKASPNPWSNVQLQTPLSLAMQLARNADLIELLIEYGARLEQ